MSASKFFTWTKGAAYETPKTRRKPLPLDFEYQSSETRSVKSSRTNDSIALQDAAVQSATSLLAVMNDCLNSHLLSTQQKEVGLKPMHGRPRSRTAPSTPMYEVSDSASPVELPGCIPPLQPRKTRALHQSMDGKPFYTAVSVHNDSVVGNSIERPHSSPQEPHHAFSAHPRQCSDSCSQIIPNLRPPSDIVPRAKTAGPYLHRKINSEIPFSTSDDTLVASESDPFLATLKRPSLSYLASWQHKVGSTILRLSASRASSTRTSVNNSTAA